MTPQPPPGREPTDASPAGQDAALLQLVPDLGEGGGLVDLARLLLPDAPCLDVEAFLRCPPDTGTLLVHYSGYGYAANGAPARLVEQLLGWRRQRPGRRLLLHVHELYARQPPWRKGFWWAGRQRRVLLRLAQGADGLITNLERHARWLRRQGLPPAAVLPVPSNVGEPQEPPPLAQRSPRLVVFGGRAQRQAAYRALAPLGPLLHALELQAIDDIGPPLPEPPPAPLPLQVHGRLPAAEVDAKLQAARAAAVAYPLDFVAKSGIFAAISAHGCLPLLLHGGRLPGPCDGLLPGRELLRPWQLQARQLRPGLMRPRQLRPGGRAAPLAPDAQQAIATAAWRWYQGHRLSVQRRQVQAWLAGSTPPPAAARPLKLLLYCHAYLPSLGGLERAGQLLAEQLSQPEPGSGAGPRCRLELVTATATDDPAWDRAQPYRIHRQPSFWTRLRLVAAADLVHSNGASLAVSLPAVLLGKPLVITHQGYQLVSVDGLGWGEEGPTPLTPAASLAWYRRRLPWPAWFRQVLLLHLRRWVAQRAAANVAITAWVERRQPLPRSLVIANPVALAEEPVRPAGSSSGRGRQGTDQRLDSRGLAPGAAATQAWSQRPWDLLFLGRLVQEKGLDVLLEALALLRTAADLQPRLLVIGDGPRREAWQVLSERLGLAERVSFAGSLRGTALTA
ncbi:MAG: glycosyltransferase, partial [Synechococcaceae cyanobacterium]|nr:glycosyltransferase [Synechococcaceae cyanobacterium]